VRAQFQRRWSGVPLLKVASINRMCHKGGNKSVASAGYGFVNSLPRAPLSLRDCCACEIPPAEQNPTLPKKGMVMSRDTTCQRCSRTVQVRAIPGMREGGRNGKRVAGGEEWGTVREHCKPRYMYGANLSRWVPDICFPTVPQRQKTPPTLPLPYSSSTGISSSIYRIKDILISVESLPRNTSLIKWASTCICTISSAPRKTPQNILEYHSSSCARPSSGNSTKSARGFSSKIKENCLLSLVQFVTAGVMLRKILNPTWRSQ
jgi:hypothetical protein